MSDPLVAVAMTVWTERQCSGEDLADASGVTPTSAWTIGQTRVSPNGHVYPKPYDSTGWRLELGRRRTLDLPGMLEELRQMVEPASSRIAAQVDANEVEVQLSMHIYMSEQTPIGTVPASVVALAARLGATLDIDLYIEDSD